MVKKGLSEEEIILFRSHMEGVKPLADSGHMITPKTPPNPPSKSAHTSRTTHEITMPATPYLTQELYQTIESNAYLSFCRPHFDKRVFKYLQQGKLPIRRCLDLHGMQRAQASEALVHCIQGLAASNQYEERLRCARIIHGKGGKMGEAPIMKSFVNIWLPECNEVMAFCSAQPKDGGLGAVYVLIKIALYEKAEVYYDDLLCP